MPLPQQVINQLNRDPETTPGWSSGVLWFSFGIFAIVILIYLFLALFYEPHLNTELTSLQSNVATVDQSIASTDETQLMTFYSQVVNLKSVLSNHIIFSQFLDWLQQSTEANVYFSQFSFSSGNQVALTGYAESEADINQQIAIFEASPVVKKVAVSDIAVPAASGFWSFSATLIVDPGVFTSSQVLSLSATSTIATTTTP